MEKRIYLCLAHMGGNEMKYIQEAFDTNWVVPLGPNVNAFEEELERFVGQGKRVVALSAGTAAMHLALIQAGVGPGDEVVCQSFTFCASANPVAYLGATPVFVDSEEDTWNMNPVLLEEAIQDRMAKTGKTSLWHASQDGCDHGGCPPLCNSRVGGCSRGIGLGVQGAKMRHVRPVWRIEF